MPLALRYAARSDVGLVRKGNEDSGYAGPRLLVVADGMGGHAAGELASATAVATLAEMVDGPLTQEEVLTGLAMAVDQASESIGLVVSDNPELAGMGTTATALYWLGDRLALVHVGDSRAYLLRNSELTQITHDHTYVQTLVDAGRISEDEAELHPRRSLLMRAIDGSHPVEADLSVREARVGDRYLVCSDGLTGVVKDSELRRIMAEGEPTGTVIALVDLALARGAPDNVTVVIADVLEVADDSELVNGDSVVVGAAGEPRVRARLPRVHFPKDAQVDPNRPDLPPDVDGGPPTSELPTVPGVASGSTVAGGMSARAKRNLRIGIVAAVAVIALGAIVVASSTAWVRSQWYVGVAGEQVAIYQGVPGAFLGVPLQSAITVTDLPVGTLPLFDADVVARGIVADGRPGAERIVADLRLRAAACAVPLPPAGCPAPAPAPTPAPSPSPAVTP